jgi:hypothetical protein
MLVSPERAQALSLPWNRPTVLLSVSDEIAHVQGVTPVTVNPSPNRPLPQHEKAGSHTEHEPISDSIPKY